MTVYVDTSALYAALNASDANHEAAKEIWASLARQREVLVTSSYVLVETISLISHRFGPQAVRDFQALFMPTIKVHWVDESIHGQAVAALLTAGNRDLSLVDCVSFEVMRRLSLDTVLAFDAHFARQGFQCIP